MAIPAIAIHRSGPSDRIARSLDACFKNSAPVGPTTTLAFDLGRVNARPNYKGLRNLFRFLRHSAANIGAAAHQGLEFGAHPLDAQLGAWQIRLHRALQWTVASLIALVTAIWLTNLTIMLPAAAYGLPTSTFAPMRWMEGAAGYLKLGIGGGVTLLILLAGLRLLLTLSPRPVIITFRSIVLLAVQPVLTLAVGLLAMDLLPLGVLLGATGSVVVLTGGGMFLPWLLAAGTIVGLRASWSRGPLQRFAEGVLEVFRYLGEPDYRQRVHEALDRAISRARERAGEGEDFVLAGQGLGSMIALDSILHSRVWRHTDRVVLVTMGSPLRRFFLPLYPRTLFPESMEDVVDLIAGRLHEFRWINLYHRRDLAGGALGLKPFNGLDIPTGGSSSWLPARADYWQSTDARRALHDGLQRLRQVQPLRVPMKDAAHRLLEPEDLVLTLAIPPRVRTSLVTIVGVATFGWMLWWVATGSGVLASTTDAAPQVLVDAGVVVEASATHRRHPSVRDRGITYIDHWEFAFTDPNDNPQSIRVQRDASDAFLAIRPPRFDDRALAEHVRAGCVGTWPVRWWKLKGSGTSCTTGGIRLRYYPGDLSLFDLPDYPRHRLGSDPIRGWSEAGAVAAILSPLFLLPVLLGAGMFAMLSGLRETDFRPRSVPPPAPVRVPAQRPAVTGRA